MTAIITKQNAIDKAFIGGSGSGSDYPTDAEFDTIKVNKEATFTVNNQDITFANHETRITTLETTTPTFPTDATFDTIKVNKDATFTVNNQDITFANHETRIKTLEESGGGSGGDSSFTYSFGYPEIIISTNLTETDEDNNHTLTIDIDHELYKDYVGDMIEFTLPSEIAADLTTYRVVAPVKISRQADGTYTCPVIEYKNTAGTEEEPVYKYVLTNTPNQTTLFIRMISLLDNPLSIFTSGNMEIKSVIQQPSISTPNNIKCNIIEADNAFSLYRSPIPNVYEMIDCGVLNTRAYSYWYAFWGYQAHTEEVNNLIDGQEFHFEDNAFGTSYLLTYRNREWTGNNLCYYSEALVTKNDYQSDFARIYLANTATNIRIIDVALDSSPLYEPSPTNDSDYNPLKRLYDNNLFKFNGFPANPKYIKDGKDGDYYYIDFINDDDYPDRTDDISISFTLGDMVTTCQWEFRSISDTSMYHAQSNQIERLGISKSFHIWDRDWESQLNVYEGIFAFMDKDVVVPLTGDINYQEGTNPFEYLRATDYYNVEPRPEACTTLYTNYNIRTTGNVIGQNIESHVFALNSLGNDVDRAIVRLSQLTQYVQQAMAQVEAQIESLQSAVDAMTIGQLVDGAFGLLSTVTSFVATGAKILGGASEFESVATKAITADSLKISEKVEAGTATLTDITATGEASFNTITSTGKADFGEIFSSGKATIADITLEDGAIELEDIVSTGEANFTGTATFTGETTFNNITSTGTATFKDLVIEDGAIELEDIVSSGEATFNNITANGESTFNRITTTDFMMVGAPERINDAALTTSSLHVADWVEAGEMELEDIVSTGEATFNNITSSGKADFGEIFSSGKATIADITLEEGAIELEDITASGTATLTNIESTGEASFNTITSTGKADFGEIFSSGKATIADITLEDGAIELEDITATGTANFTGEATFNNITSTGKVTIGDITIVDGEIELEDISATTADFENITSTGEATFNNITSSALKAETLDVENSLTVHEMNVEHIDVYEFSFITPEPANVTDSAANTKVVITGIDTSGYDGEYSDNHIMSSKAIKELIDKHTNGVTTSNQEIERRISVLELKLKNIAVTNDARALSGKADEPVALHNLTLEERLELIERKCANIQ